MADRGETTKKGFELLRDARFNKGSAFDIEERRANGMHGLLPHAVETEELQLERELMNLKSRPDHEDKNLDQYMYLMELLNRNEALFYKLIVKNIKYCMPLVYTPTVGKACQNYSRIWSQPRGLYISKKDKGSVIDIVKAWPTRDIKAIVFTDGERILGLGDQGVNGMGIPVGKLQLYSACARIPPWQCLPVQIDNGTHNGDYIKDKFYMGLREERVNGPEYDELIEEFMTACQKVFGKTVLLQFEDFGNSTAFHLLANSRERFTTFNDDIQGTACVALAGVIASLKVDGTPDKLKDHRIVFLGCGEAGTGIGSLIAYAIAKEDGIPIEEARKNIFFCDRKGLVTAKRGSTEKLAHHKHDWTHDASGLEGDLSKFEDVVKAVKPTMIVGVSAQPKKFTPAILKLMAEYNEKPVIFALSNPTTKCECTALEAYENTNNTCIFASGSPFGVVENNGKSFEPGQGNNAYVFPGIALGVIAAEATKIPEDIFYLAAVALADLVKPEDLARGSVYPPLEEIQNVSFEIGVKVAEYCFENNIAKAPKPDDIRALLASKQFQV